MAEAPISTRIAEPCRARQVLHGRVVVDPSDGRERLWLTNMNEAQGGELIAVDFESDTAEVYRWPAGHGSWCVLPLPGDRLAVSTYYDGKFLLFDLKAKEFTGVVDFPGESYIWDMAIGGDGRVYGGTYSGAKLGCFDPDTGEFEDCGTPVADTGNLYLRNVIATPDGNIACTFGYAESSFQVYNVETGEFRLVWSEATSLHRMTMDHLFVSTASRGLVAIAGRDLRPVASLPLPECPNEAGWQSIEHFGGDDEVYLRSDGKLWRWSRIADDMQLVLDVDLRGGHVLDVSADGRMLGVRGQDYFVVTPGEKDINLRRIPGESAGRPTHFLVSDDAGNVWGGSQFGQTVFACDTATGEYENSGAVVDAGGEVYGAVLLRGNLYTASYSAADLAVYDPREAWDQWGGRNPRHIASLREYNLCRPTGRMFLGGDGMLISGWQASYGMYGGALVRLNPATEEITVWSNPLGEEPIVALAVDDRYAYLGTNLSANGLPTKDGWGQFGVWDLTEEGLVFSQRMDGMKAVCPIGTLPEPRLVLFPHGDELNVFDVADRAFRDTLPVETLGSPGWGEDVLTAADGCAVFARGAWLVYVSPDLDVRQVGPLEGRIDHMTYASDGKLYYMSGSTLYRAEGV